MSEQPQTEPTEGLHYKSGRRWKLPPGECKTCDEWRDEKFHPAHDASPRCQSGKHSHCTCDTCF